MAMTPRISGAAAVRFFVALLGCALLLGATIARNAAYHDPMTLWSDAVPRSPGKARPHYNLGNALRDSGDMDRAIREWQMTVQIDPGYSMAYNQLGNVCFLSGSLKEAERFYTLSLTSEPDNAEAHYNLALISESLGKTEQAIYHYQQFLARGHSQPDDVLRQAASRLQVLRKP